MIQPQRFNKVLKYCIILGDLIILNVLLITITPFYIDSYGRAPFIATLPQVQALLSLCYLACTFSGGVILHRWGARAAQVALCVLRNVFLFAILSTFMLEFGEFKIKLFFFAIYWVLLFISITIYRLIFRFCIVVYRNHNKNVLTVVYVGSTKNIAELYQQMSADKASDYHILGYFDLTPNANFPIGCSYLGKPDEVIPYLNQHRGSVNLLYCSLPSKQNNYVVPIIDYCENNLVHFYNVPNVRNYLCHSMHLEMIGDVPVLSIRKRPLSKIENKILKRTFDIIFSFAALCFLIPFVFTWVSIVIKITSPGPIFFRQKRNGLNGKEFWCYKFRSMNVNKEADTLQATANDPRKTKFGNFMRRTNIDELPQFFNVLKGDMSVVGPRPHMLKHTEEYSKIIKKYMVRHFIKPGITGWAQVTGFRGETKEVEEMEGRVKADIWYMEHWSFQLDLYIIYRTIANAMRKDKQAY